MQKDPKVQYRTPNVEQGILPEIEIAVEIEKAWDLDFVPDPDFD